MKPRLAIWGASGHARVVADIVRLMDTYDLVGFLNDVDTGSEAATVCGLPVFRGRQQLDVLAQSGVEYMIVGFGDCQARLRISEAVLGRGFRLATAIHPRATVAADALIGTGTVIAAGAVVNPACRIGENVIINTCASVDHECELEDGVHVCPGAHLAGRIVVGRGAWIGIGATLRDRVRIGAGTVVGAGSVVLRDLPDHVVAYGVPARVIREINTNG